MAKVNEILQKLMSFRWKHLGYSKYSCISCGSIAYNDYDGKGMYRTGNEQCSISCPWRQAEEYLNEN